MNGTSSSIRNAQARRQRCDRVRGEVAKAIESSLCEGTWRDFISRSDLHCIVFSEMGIEPKDFNRFPVIMTVIGEEIKRIFNQDVVQSSRPNRVRGFYGIKRKAV